MYGMFGEFLIFDFEDDEFLIFDFCELFFLNKNFFLNFLKVLEFGLLGVLLVDLVVVGFFV